MSARWTAEQLRAYAKRGAGAQAAVNAVIGLNQRVEARMIERATAHHKTTMNKLEALRATPRARARRRRLAMVGVQFDQATPSNRRLLHARFRAYRPRRPFDYP